MKKISFFLFIFLSIGSSYAQPERSFAVSNTYDVIVYGGTASGVMAAYTAKQMGKSVLLIEPGNRIGGLTTGGLGYLPRHQ